MYQCNLSFRQLHAYLDFLIERELLKSVAPKANEKNDAVIYETTNRGKAFIQAYRVINAILSAKNDKLNLSKDIIHSNETDFVQ
jgi:predicted transcriptional regulator